MAGIRKAILDELHARYNRREFVHPDPLEYLYAYDDPRDREIVGLIASGLAYGRVDQIGRSIARVLPILGRAPSLYLAQASLESLRSDFARFKHRFTTGEEMAALLFGVKRAIERRGSLNACFLSYYDPSHPTVLPAATGFVDEIAHPSSERPGAPGLPLRLQRRLAGLCDDPRLPPKGGTPNSASGTFGVPPSGGLFSSFVTAGGRARPSADWEQWELLGGARNSLLPSPASGSACKRLHLFLRWMVRCDEVDPGGWAGIPASQLIVPLDVHMHRLSLALGLTRRRQADGCTALDVTAGFRAIAPDDPVRYDFALTRLGIRTDAEGRRFLEQLGL